MLGLDLKINDLEIKLGMPLNREVFNSHNILEPSDFEKQVIVHFPGETIFWSKNCEISCYQTDIVLKPNLEIGKGVDSMFGTSAYLYFIENLLGRVTFQLVGNKNMAEDTNSNFIKYMWDKIGKPKKAKNNMTAWNMGMEHFLAEKIPTSEHVHFHWVLAPPEYLDSL